MDGDTIILHRDLGDVHGLVGDAKQHLRHAMAAILLAFEEEIELSPGAVKHLQEAQTKIGRAITELQGWDQVRPGDTDALDYTAARR